MSKNKQEEGFHIGGFKKPEEFSLSYDSVTGIIGFGYRYGEQSINGEPLHPAPPHLFWGPKGPLYDPFARNGKGGLTRPRLRKG